MDYRARRLEQRKHKRLGCIILATAVLGGILASYIIMSVTWIVRFVPLGNSIAFYVLAVVIGGVIDRGLRRILGYQARKASLRHLKTDASADPIFPSPPPTEEED